MNPKDLAQAWAIAYGISFAAAVLGAEIRNSNYTPDEIDERARLLADRVMQTVSEKLNGNGKHGDH